MVVVILDKDGFASRGEVSSKEEALAVQQQCLRAALALQDIIERLSEEERRRQDEAQEG